MRHGLPIEDDVVSEAGALPRVCEQTVDVSKIPDITSARAIFMVMPSRHPNTENSPTLAPAAIRLRTAHSTPMAPTKQPTSAPAIVPTNGIGTRKDRNTIPRMPPSSAPHAACLLAPAFRAVAADATSSTTSAVTAIITSAPRIDSPTRSQSVHQPIPSARTTINHVPGSRTAARPTAAAQASTSNVIVMISDIPVTVGREPTTSSPVAAFSCGNTFKVGSDKPAPL